MSVGPYLAAEDSALLREALKGLHGGICLEIGAGNGGNLAELVLNFMGIVGTDLVRPEMSDWAAKGADFVLADLASCFADSTFDVVAYNPPYLREEGARDLATEGGEKMRVPDSFMAEALRVVKDEGRILFLLNQDADLQKAKDQCGRKGFVVRPLLERHLFFERLTVYEARRPHAEHGKPSAWSL